MAINTYGIGDLVRVTGTFRASDDALVDPTTVVAKVRNPLGAITTYTYGVDAALVRTSTGIYYVEVSAALPGSYWTRFEASGIGQCAGEQETRVRPSQFA